MVAITRRIREPQPSERLSVFDLAELAMDVGPNPRSIGALLEIEGPAVDATEVRDAVRARLHQVPRLSQRVRRTPLGVGRPLWQDAVVDLDHHVRARSATADDLLGVAAAVLSEPMDPRRPPWRLTVVDLPSERRSALVWSSHHAMADGPSLLVALLAMVGDAQGPGVQGPVPLPRRVGRCRRLLGLRELAASSMMRVPPSPLNRPVTAGYAVRAVDVDLPGVHDGARRSGATVNDALLWAWGRALHRRLDAADLQDLPVVVSFTVSAASQAVQNRVGAVRVRVPAPGPSVLVDLRQLGADTMWRKRWTTGSSWWLTAQVFRLLGALGLNRRLMKRQRSITSLVTNLHGPAGAPSVLGRPVRRAVPLTTLVGNVTTMLAALSYGDRMVATVVCSPESAHLLDLLTVDLAEGLAEVAAGA